MISSPCYIASQEPAYPRTPRMPGKNIADIGKHGGGIKNEAKDNAIENLKPLTYAGKSYRTNAKKCNSNKGLKIDQSKVNSLMECAALGHICIWCVCPGRILDEHYVVGTIWKTMRAKNQTNWQK